jgi:glutamate-ammonia-ligase adenylyltransferase
MSDLADALDRARRHSPFLRALVDRDGALLEQVMAAGPEAGLADALGRLDPARPAASLRQARHGVALTVALADLAGRWRLEAVTGALSRFADRAIGFAIDAAFAEQGAEPAGLVALALGKLGSRELNYSSDVDLIFLHDPETLPRRSTEEPTQAAVRLVRRVVALLAERTADGYTARVDLRLRPDPSSTPASLPVGAAESYYQAQALAWERAAFIRARPVAGDLALGMAFLESIRPFVWRRSLDFSALADIRETSHQIRDHLEGSDRLGPGFDLKRGRGGIREIEFYTQVHQLIFGGRDERLRPGATLEALAALAEAGLVPPGDARLLAEAYRAHRTLEHRFQMLADQQTHAVPRLAAERAAVAGLLGATGWKAVETDLAPRLKAVARLYDRLLESGGEARRGPRIPQGAVLVERWAKGQRLKDPALLISLMDGWRAGRPRSLRAPEARRAFEAVIPGLVTGVSRAGRPGLLRLGQLIDALPSGVQFWRLLAANPALAQTLARLLTATPLVADALARRPVLIDALLQPAPPLPDLAAARTDLDQVTAGLEGEALLDRVRQWNGERRFLIAARLAEGEEAPLAAARTLALMAEATVERLAQAVEAAFAARHGRVPGGRLVLLALGRLGGGLLTAQSDLDLVFLFTGSFETRADGDPPLTASTWFNRLGTRIVAALSVPTAAGTLFEVDTRLRPSGADGLLVVSLDSFARYQSGEAEFWETMALTRARPIACTPEDARLASATVERILARRRDPREVRREALAMRRLMARHKPARGPFDVKLMKGGLVDIEFILAARALIAGQPVSPDLEVAAAALAPGLVEPFRLMMATLVMLRLSSPHDSGATPDAAAGQRIAQACGKTGLAALKAGLQEARRNVGIAWTETFGKGEGDAHEP